MLLNKLLNCRKLACIIYQLLIFIAVLYFPLASSASAANLLTNPGFETGDFTGWSVGGNSISNGVDTNGAAISGTYYTSNVITRSGNYAGYAVVTTAPIQRITLTQTVSVLPNQDIQVGFWMGCNSTNQGFGVDINDSELQIFVDGVGLIPNSSFAFSSCNTGEYKEISSSFNTGTNTSVQVTYAITGSGSGSAGFSFDDFYVNYLDVPDVPCSQCTNPTCYDIIGTDENGTTNSDYWRVCLNDNGTGSLESSNAGCYNLYLFGGGPGWFNTSGDPAVGGNPGWTTWIAHGANESGFLQPIGDGYLLTGIGARTGNTRYTIQGKKVPCIPKR